MGDFVYNGEHAILISGINTWERWHMAPKTRPFVVEPSVKTEYIDVPGADGSLDYTDVLTGKARYGQRTGSWDFIVDNGYADPFKLQSDILNTLHGKKHVIVLTDEPDYKYTGRLSAKVTLGNKDYVGVSISYNLDPFKVPIDSVANTWWKWNDLFSNTIILGPFSVFGSKCRGIVNENDSNITANIHCNTAMKVIRVDDIPGYSITEDRLYYLIKDNFDETTYASVIDELDAGDNEYTLKPGVNTLYFIGNSSVTIDFSWGSML